MTKGRDIAAESVAAVLELIRRRRQSGLLSIERALGSWIEEGEIYFQGGRPIYARTGRLVGEDALSLLLAWRQIYFIFLTNVPSPPANLSASAATNFSTDFSSPAPSAPPITSSSLTGNVSASNRGEPEGDFASGASRGNSPGQGVEGIVPQKSSNEQDLLSLPLTRRQRTIYLLVDGRRTIRDLARCTGKTIQEVERILSEIQEQGLIVV